MFDLYWFNNYFGMICLSDYFENSIDNFVHYFKINFF